MAGLSIQEVKEMLLTALNLDEEYDPDDVGDDDPLFGDEGLGLDSLDALQLAVAIEERYGVTVDEGQGASIFRSPTTIRDHIAANRA